MKKLVVVAGVLLVGPGGIVVLALSRLKLPVPHEDVIVSVVAPGMSVEDLEQTS